MIARYPGRDAVTGEPIRRGEEITRHGSGWTHVRPVRDCSDCGAPGAGVLPREDCNGVSGVVCKRCNREPQELLSFSEPQPVAKPAAPTATRGRCAECHRSVRGRVEVEDEDGCAGLVCIRCSHIPSYMLSFG